MSYRTTVAAGHTGETAQRDSFPAWSGRSCIYDPWGRWSEPDGIGTVRIRLQGRTIAVDSPRLLVRLKNRAGLSVIDQERPEVLRRPGRVIVEPVPTLAEWLVSE